MGPLIESVVSCEVMITAGRSPDLNAFLNCLRFQMESETNLKSLFKKSSRFACKQASRQAGADRDKIVQH
jgi:hypothetical protein